MGIVYSLHFKRSVQQYVDKAREYHKNKQYQLALDEWKKALNEGYYLALNDIASLYYCGYVTEPGKSQGELYQDLISLTRELLTHDVREYDYKRAYDLMGSGYEKLGDAETALNCFYQAEEQGLYSLYHHYYMRGDYKTSDKYYDQYTKAERKGDTGSIYFDL